MTFEIIFVLLALLGMVVALALDKMRPGMVLFSVVVLFLCAGILTPKEMLEGFSNKGMITVAMLFLVSEGIRQSGALGQVIKKLLPQGKTTVFKAQFRMLPTISFISAFLNNTPVVVIFAPIIKRWAESVKLPATKFLIPLSYVTILGGICTLIGTSTNLVVHGMILEAGYEGFTMFELGKVGIFIAIAGIIYLFLFSSKLLPDVRTDGLANGSSNAYDNYYLAMPYLERIKSGKVGTKELDEKVRRILRLAFRTTMDVNRPFGSILSPEHYEAARRIGEEGIVLLQNKDGVLPIDLNKVKKIAVIGENAVKMMTVGGGSSSLKVQRELSPLDGIKNRVGNKAEVVYARGYVGDARGEYNGVVTGQNLQDDRTPEELIAEAVKVAADADYVIFIGGLNKSNNQDCEDTDRAGLELPYGQDAVISALAKANKNLVVINVSGNAVAMPWIAEVPSVLQAWFLGSEAGNSIAAVLMGDANPSGKLPFTFPARLEDVPAHSVGEYISQRSKDVVDMKYNEGIFVGYRWADKQKKVKPLFPFGHGLSYTTFAYGKPAADKKVMSADDQISFTVTVKNAGDREGQEVVQLYISDKKSSLPRPVKELKGFKKVKLAPGEEKEITFTIDKEALSYFDDAQHAWVAEPGKFEAVIAASAADIKGIVPFELK